MKSLLKNTDKTTGKIKSGEQKGRSKNRGISRRRFFKQMGSGIATYFVLTDIVASQVLGSTASERLEDSIASWIHVNEKGKITVFTGKVEVGQNIRTSLTQVVAEELCVALEDIHLIMGDTELTPYDRGTYGSLTTPQMAPILRKAAANLREILLQQARNDWNLGQVSLELEQGMVHHPSNGGKLSYADLAKGKQLLEKMDNDVKTVSPKDWKIAGTSVKKVNGKDYITGSHQYVSDMSLPGMQYGKILRAPYLGAKLVKVDTKKAEGLDGVSVVRDGDFIGVVAKDSRSASVALAMIDAAWEREPQLSRKELFGHLVKTGAEKPAANAALNNAFSASPVKIEHEYQVDYIAHVPLEPRAGLAHWEDENLKVWTGTQRPFGVQEELQRIFNMPKENIRVYMPDTGSGYGGKHTGEAGIEAARLSKAVGKPVKVNWTREEEFKWAYFRPAGLIKVKGSTNEGKLSSWDFHNYNSGGAGIETPYVVKEKNHQYHGADSPLRQGSYRSLASTANIFAMESMMDDLANANEVDPLNFRLQHLEDERLKAVLTRGAEAFGWGKRKASATKGFGMACGAVKGGFVSTFAEVAVNPDTRELKVMKITAAFECGAIINPRHLRSQVLGCFLQGLGGALFEKVDFKNGDILNASLSSYRVPRFNDMPKIEVVLINRIDLPSSGAGEAPIVCVAPALRNAIYDATGVSLHQLPMLPSGVVPQKT